ncbi:hypothetical protein [Filomicrobium sp.]|uniref:hypothetical protein n=1 Tax=Filomicrobium sp. TaxID=2024831 RepID=UPI002590E4B2|nr:hypothetical protein [Filomicrobium sp.]MCV0368909.1 hypothetical protein [Filomicrobium sp.]
MPTMLAWSVGRPVEEEGEIFGERAKFGILLANGRAGENFRGGREQPIIRPRMNGETGESG